MNSCTSEMIEHLVGRLEAASDPVRALNEQAYLKSPLEHLGVRVPTMRRILRAQVRGAPDLDHSDLVDLVSQLWRIPIYELRFCAVDALCYRTELLTADDLRFIHEMISSTFTWALVDPLAIDVVGAITLRLEAGQADQVLDRWATDESFWVRRAAMLSQLRYLRDPESDPQRFFRYADAMLDEREFFIRKAIGWVLRDMSKRRPDLVFDWLLPRAARASGVTVREAMKYLSTDQRDAIQRAKA